MTESSGTVATDSTGNGYDGTFGGTLPTAVAGQNQDGQSFNGTTDHISSIKSYGALFDGSNDYSIECYSLINVNNTNQTLFYPRSDHNLQLDYRGDNGTGYRLLINDGAINSVQVSALSSVGVMRHVLATATTGGNMELYLDNAAQGAPVPLVAPNVLSDTDNNMIGAVNPSGFQAYNGILQSTIVHNTVRSAGYRLTAHNNISNPVAFTTPSAIIPATNIVDLSGWTKQLASPIYDGDFPHTLRDAQITGSGFGAKLASTPYYDDFESEPLGPTGTSINELIVSTVGATNIVDSDSNSGTRCVSHLFTAIDFPKIHKSLSGTGKTVYMSCALKISGSTGANASIWKLGRVGAGPAYDGVPKASTEYSQTFVTDRPTNVTSTMTTEPTAGNETDTTDSSHNTAADGTISSIYIPDVWLFYEVELYGGTIDASDAYFSERVSGKDTTLFENRPFLTTVNSSLLDWVMTPINGLDGLHAITYLMDDIYIDESRCRVVMTDTALYSAATKFAVQPIVEWSDTKVVYTAKRQNFAVSDTAYIHAFDESGLLVHSGTAITVEEDK